jgi:hypothetical protein
VVIRKEKVPKRKENRPAGKVENAMKPRFPLSHRACHQKQGNDRGIRTQINKEGGLSAAIIVRRTWSVRRCHNPATDPALSNCRDPVVLVDAEQTGHYSYETGHYSYGTGHYSYGTGPLLV